MEVKISNLENKLIFKADLPGSWDELSGYQFRKIYRYLYATPGKPDYIKNRLKVCFILLLSSTKNPFKKLWIIYNVYWKLNPLQVYDLCEVIKFLFDTFPRKAFIKSFTHKGVRYHLPDDRLENVVILEYTYADSYLERVSYDTSLESLDKLIATLCRPQKLFWRLTKYSPNLNTGDRRERFNPHIMIKRAPRFKDLSIHTKLMVLYFFVGCKLDIIDTYRYLFPKKKGDDFQGDQGSNWIEVMKDVAETRLYGDYEKSAYGNLHTILNNMDLEQKKNVESEKKRKK